jgi:tRNA(adenine34) deaminase
MDQALIEQLIKECQTEAAKAIAGGNKPFGCVITDRNGRIVAREHNTSITDTDPTAHAEVKAISTLARKLKSRHLDDYFMFANAASCSMCMCAAVTARITHYYYGAPSEGRMDPWLTMEEIAAKSQLPINIHGTILGDECAEQITRAYQKGERT